MRCSLARRAGAAARRPGADPQRGRGIPALRELQPARQPRLTGALRDRRRDAGGRHLHHASASARPTAIRRSSPSPTASTSAASRTGTSPSARACIMCLGAVLARLEGTIAIGRLVARSTAWRARRHERGGRARFRGFNRYPIAWEAKSRDSERPARAARSPPPREPEQDPPGRRGAGDGHRAPRSRPATAFRAGVRLSRSARSATIASSGWSMPNAGRCSRPRARSWRPTAARWCRRTSPAPTAPARSCWPG